MGEQRAKVSAVYVAVVVTAEVIGHDLSERAAEAIARELAAYPPESALAALKRCQRELSGRLTLAAVLQRIDDGRPSADEAWAMLPRDESQTVVWTDEMSDAHGIARALDDDTAARMAFRSAYERLVLHARNARLPAKWRVSFGHDVNGRGGPLVAAVEAKRITVSQARAMLDPGASSFDAIDDRLRKLEGKPPAPRLGAGTHYGVPPEAIAFLVSHGKGTRS